MKPRRHDNAEGHPHWRRRCRQKEELQQEQQPTAHAHISESTDAHGGPQPTDAFFGPVPLCPGRRREEALLLGPGDGSWGGQSWNARFGIVVDSALKSHSTGVNITSTAVAFTMQQHISLHLTSLTCHLLFLLLPSCEVDHKPLHCIIHLYTNHWCERSNRN